MNTCFLGICNWLILLGFGGVALKEIKTECSSTAMLSNKRGLASYEEVDAALRERFER